MTYLQAAIAVLKNGSRSMTAREITEVALKEGFIKTKGKTPEATMRAALYGVRNMSNGVLVRESFAGPIRAARDSVRWSLNPTASVHQT